MNSRQAALLSADHEVIPFKKKRTRSKTVQPKVDNYTLLSVKPLTEGQRQMFRSFKEGLNVIASGSAGTGKSFCAAHLALDKLFAKDIDKIIVMRSIVPTRDVGFLPGSLEEKVKIYEEPYKAIINELCQSGTAYESMTKKGIIEFMSTSFLRGLTFKNCVIIMDEAQNSTWHEINSLMTRAGENCQIVVCGDTHQCDLNTKKEQSGFGRFLHVASKLSSHFDLINFTWSDIVRSDFVKQWIIEVEKEHINV
jgi:phosphate starvation-inducible protein PhoH